MTILKHEFGHALGLEHGDEPAALMDPVMVDLDSLPKPDATERDLPWNHSTLTVAVDLSNVPTDERATVEHQIDETLAYYEAGAEGTIPEHVTFQRIDNPETADITIRFSADSPCPSIDESGSCFVYRGITPDEDDAVEYYTHIEIVLTNLDPETVAWHVGSNLGNGFGNNEPSELPEPLRPDASSEVIRSEWWES